MQNITNPSKVHVLELKSLSYRFFLSLLSVVCLPFRLKLSVVQSEYMYSHDVKSLTMGDVLAVVKIVKYEKRIIRKYLVRGLMQ